MPYGFLLIPVTVKKIQIVKEKKMLEGKEIAEISWVPTNTQIAYSLTKKGVPSFKILGFMSAMKESSV